MSGSRSLPKSKSRVALLRQASILAARHVLQSFYNIDLVSLAA